MPLSYSTISDVFWLIIFIFSFFALSSKLMSQAQGKFHVKHLRLEFLSKNLKLRYPLSYMLNRLSFDM